MGGVLKSKESEFLTNINGHAGIFHSQNEFNSETVQQFVFKKYVKPQHVGDR